MNEVASILADLKTIVTAPDATEEAKLLAPSIAYQVAKKPKVGRSVWRVRKDFGGPDASPHRLV